MDSEGESQARNIVFADVAVIGGGAAGLAAAIFAARHGPSLKILVLDGAKKLGAKILISGGGRCNVTNREVTPADFRGGSPHIVRRILSAFPADQTVEFFRQTGVMLHEEEDGKLFPDTHSARTVLEAMLAEAARRGVRILTDHRVTALERCGDGFDISTSAGLVQAGRVVLATGGKSLPKTGSDGCGYELAGRLGHSLVAPTPALAPLVLGDDFHAALSGVSQDVVLQIRVAGAKPARLRGPMLWTHFGVSGPVVLNASGLWHRARLEQREVTISANFLPDDGFESTEARFLELASRGPKAALRSALAAWLPARVAAAMLGRLGIAPHVPMAHVSRDMRRRMVHALVEWPLLVKDSRGYSHAEVTAGGVPLEEIDPATMASRHCPGLYLVGEILDVDGRIGGFNFQWAWSSGWVAGRALAKV